MSSKKNVNPTRQRGTPSPGTNGTGTMAGTRVSPRRATPGRPTSSTTQPTPSTTHRRVGSGSGGNAPVTRVRAANSTIVVNTRQPSRDEIFEGYDDDDFLSKSSGYPTTTDRADEEVLSIYLESLKNPKERDSIQNFVNQQKIDAGYDVDPRQPPVATKKGQLNPISTLNIKQSTTIVVGPSDIESNVSDQSDTTEIIGYSVPKGKGSGKQNGSAYQQQRHYSFEKTDGPKSSETPLLSPRPGAQRAILEIASQMSSDDVLEVMELLARGHGISMAQLQSMLSPHPNPTPTMPTKQHIPSPNTRRGKSGPPILQSSSYHLNEDDEEVIQHTKYNETYRIIPPTVPAQVSNHPPLLPSQHSLAQKSYRCGSAASNASGTNSNCNSRNTTPINPSSKKSPIPINMNQHDYCPTVIRENSSTARSADPNSQSLLNKAEVVPPLVLPKSERVQKNHSSKGSVASTSSDDIRSALFDNTLQSPRGSAFDDCSLSSSSSNFTSASTRSGRSKGSASVPTTKSTTSRPLR